MPMSNAREALIEFTQVGNCVKVSAVDPQTLTEVSIVGPTSASREQLTRTVVKKLHYVLARGRGFTDSQIQRTQTPPNSMAEQP